MLAPNLVLASTSRYRRDQLARLGVPFEVRAPDVDEGLHKASGLAPDEIARALAREKACAVARALPGRFVLGGDQLVDLDGEVLGKPGSAERCLAQLERLSGRAHRLVTAIALVTPEGDVHEALDLHVLHMRALTRDELARYVAADQPLDCAGSYKIEQRGIALFESIVGDDFTAIVGLPLMRVTSLLRAAGFALP